MNQTVALIVPPGEDRDEFEEEWTLEIDDAIKNGKLRKAFNDNRENDSEDQRLLLDRLVFEYDKNDDDKPDPKWITVASLVVLGVSAVGFFAAGSTGITAVTATQTRICSLWEAYGTLWKTLLTSVYLFFKTSRHFGGNTCFVVINDSPKQLDLIVKENELTVTERQEVGFTFVPADLPCFSFGQTYKKDVSRVINTIQKIPLPKEKSRKILVNDKDCYITLRSFTNCYDPDSFDSDYGLEYCGMQGYIVHLVDYRLVQKNTKLDDLAQGIIDFHPDPVFKESEPVALDETFNDDGSHREAETNAKPATAVSAQVASPDFRTEERSSPDFPDPRTDLESPPNSSRPLAPVAFSACQAATKDESSMV